MSTYSCRGCGETFERSETHFYQTSRGYLDTRCKRCRAAKQRAYHLTVKARRNEQARIWRQTHRAHVRAYVKRKRLERAFASIGIQMRANDAVEGV